jgi:hypothetical protein
LRDSGRRITFEWKAGAMFAQALAKHGLTPRMDEVYQREIATLPPKAA